MEEDKVETILKEAADVAMPITKSGYNGRRNVHW